MQMIDLEGLLHWYAVHTKPRQEERAASNLNVWSIETFSPRFKDFSRRARAASAFLIKPLFPQYIFARFDIGSLLHRVSFTRGVHSIVCFGGAPVPVDNALIELMQGQVSEDGFIKIGEDLKPGDHILIKEGPFKNFTGIFDREIKEGDRVRLLLTTISFQSHIMIERRLVKKFSAPARAGKAQTEYSEYNA